jgi:hypothetical protein
MKPNISRVVVFAGFYCRRNDEQENCNQLFNGGRV